jgi:hypothetical protein
MLRVPQFHYRYTVNVNALAAAGDTQARVTVQCDAAR